MKATGHRVIKVDDLVRERFYEIQEGKSSALITQARGSDKNLPIPLVF